MCLLSCQFLVAAPLLLISKAKSYTGGQGNLEIKRDSLQLHHSDDQKATPAVAYRVLWNGWEHKPMGTINF